ncbi:hypothetical protein F4815DRAFT_351563 [Daldinia loculata]|nr:hypothetical protein F4815DRAFT_351563 [Daldinia loculata]
MLYRSSQPPGHPSPSSIKPSVNMTPTTRHAAAAAARECQVIDPTEPSKESSVTPEPALSPSATLVSEDDGGTHESSRTVSPSREGTPSPHVRETEVKSELPERPSESKGKEPCRTHSPVMMSTKVKVEVPDLSGTTVVEASSSNTLVQPPTTPKRSRTIAAVDTDDDVDDSESSRKRRMEAASVLTKYEPVPEYWDDGPPTPVVKYEDSDLDGEENPFFISPDAQRHYDLGLDAAPIPFQRSLAYSSFSGRPQSPPPPGVPFYHPNFPQRRPLRCPNYRPNHLSFELKQSHTLFNPDRWFYVCSDCYDGFLCWADDRGVHKNNPECHCGYPSRKEMTTERSRNPRVIFYNCATKECGFRDANWDEQLSEREVNEYYGREIYPNAE